MAEIICRDVSFLQSHNLIDYSLLLAFEVSTNKFEPEKIVEKRNDRNLKQACSTAQKTGDLTPLRMTKKTAH